MPPLLFCAAAISLLLIPGPSVLYITARSAAQGRRAGVVSVLGIHTGTLVHLLAAVGGLSAVLVTSALAFSVVRFAGGAYLIGLGLKTLWSSGRVAPSDPGTPRSLGRLYRDGIVVNVLNPKTALFFLAFLPQFVRRDGSPVWLQTLVLGVVFVAFGLVTDNVYALAGARLGTWMRRRTPVAGRGPLVEGGLLIGLGVTALVVPHRRFA